MVRVVLFDIDGTLVQTGGAGMKAFERTAASAFERPNGTRQLNFAGRTDRAIIRAFFEGNGIEPSPDHFQKFFDHYVHWLGYFLPQLPGRRVAGVEGLLQGLSDLDEPPLLGLLTGNIKLGAEMKLRHFGLWDHFVVGAFGSDHEDRNELAVVARERSATHLGSPLTGDEILVIGDTPLDIECGRRIGARVMAIASGAYGADQLRAHGPDWVVEHLGEVPARELCGVRSKQISRRPEG